MGSFANALFSVLLGWLQNAASWLWRLVTEADTRAWLDWMRDNWLPLTLLLCAAGIVVDLVVYVVRWQPYRVWRNLFRRMEEAPETPQAPPEPVRHRWIFADGSSMPAPEEAVQAKKEEAASRAGARDQVRLDGPIRPMKRVQPAKRRRGADGSDEYVLPEISDETYHKPYYPPQWHDSGRSQGGRS